MTVQRPRRTGTIAGSTAIALRFPADLYQRLADRHARYHDLSNSAFVAQALSTTLAAARASGERFTAVQVAPDSTRFTVRIPDELYREIQERALRKTDASMSAIIVAAVRRALDAEEAAEAAAEPGGET